MSMRSTGLQARITKLYIDMRLKRISKLNWMMESEKAVEALQQAEHTDIVPELFYAHLLLTKEAYDAAAEVLETAADWLRVYSQESPACHAYYLYLTTLTRDDAQYDSRVVDKLKELMNKNPNIWQIQWLLYYVDRELLQDPLEQYHFLKRMFLRGCRSPLMYLEARVLLERNPAFLYEFSEFEVQLMMFMVRHAGMSERVSEILAEYMLTRTDYRYLYLIIMCGCYEVTPSKRMLEGICRMMVLGGCTGSRFSKWYCKGISEHVRTAGLYEAFLKSLPIEAWYLDGGEMSEERKLPMEVIEYFAHAPGPDDVRTAYVYALVHKYKDNWFSVYRMYEPLLKPFMLDALCRGKVNAGLAYLYENLLETSELLPERIAGFLDICHTCSLTGLPTAAGTLLVQYTHKQEPVSVYFEGGKVQLPLYGEHFTLHVYNDAGCEISAPDVQRIPMVQKALWEEFFKKQAVDNVLYHMSQAEEALDTHKIEAGAASMKIILREEQILPEFKEEVAAELLPYWDVNGVYEEILAAAPYVFSEYGTYSKAKETSFWKQQYMRNYIGIYGMQFLLDHYEGSLSEEGSIFNKAKGLGIETAAYAKHLLYKMMEEGQLLTQHTEVLETYCSTEADAETIRAFLEFEGSLHFVQEKKEEEILLQKQAKLIREGVGFSVPAQLAFLYSVVEKGIGSMGEELSEAAAISVQKLLQQNVYFSWMQPLKTVCPQLLEKEAFQVLEYRGKASGPVWVRFAKYTEGKEEPESLQSEVMELVCEGLYARSFLLFFGERIHYEIFGLEGTEQKLLKQGVLQRGQDLEKQAGSRFAKINHMLALREKRDNWELYQELEAYFGQSAVAEQLFTLK